MLLKFFKIKQNKKRKIIYLNYNTSITKRIKSKYSTRNQKLKLRNRSRIVSNRAQRIKDTNF